MRPESGSKNCFRWIVDGFMSKIRFDIFWVFLLLGIMFQLKLPLAANIDFVIHKAWNFAETRQQNHLFIIFKIAQIGVKPMPTDASR